MYVCFHCKYGELLMYTCAHKLAVNWFKQRGRSLEGIQLENVWRKFTRPAQNFRRCSLLPSLLHEDKGV